MNPFQPAAIVMVPSGDGRWLTVSRFEPPHEAALPGGFVEEGEDRRAAASRELLEETGLRTVESSLERVGIGEQEGRRVDVFLALAWMGTPQSREARRGTFGGRVRWMTWAELRAQATRFGGFLDSLAQGFRTQYGRNP